MDKSPPTLDQGNEAVLLRLDTEAGGTVGLKLAKDGHVSQAKASAP